MSLESGELSWNLQYFLTRRNRDEAFLTVGKGINDFHAQSDSRRLNRCSPGKKAMSNCLKVVQRSLITFSLYLEIINWFFLTAIRQRTNIFFYRTDIKKIFSLFEIFIWRNKHLAAITWCTWGNIFCDFHYRFCFYWLKQKNFEINATCWFFSSYHCPLYSP